MDPLGLLRLETSNFRLDLHSLFVLFINAANQVGALHLLLDRKLLGPQVFLLFLLLAHHLLDRLVLEFLLAFLHRDVLLVLLALSLKLLGFRGEGRRAQVLLLLDCVLLLLGHLLVFLHQSVFFGLAPSFSLLLAFVVLHVSGAHIEDFVGLLLGVLDLFPGLHIS